MDKLRLLKCPGLIRYCELEAIKSGHMKKSVIRLCAEQMASTGGTFESQLDMFLSLSEIEQNPGEPTHLRYAREF